MNIRPEDIRKFLDWIFSLIRAQGKIEEAAFSTKGFWNGMGNVWGQRQLSLYDSPAPVRAVSDPERCVGRWMADIFRLEFARNPFAIHPSLQSCPVVCECVILLECGRLRDLDFPRK